MIRKHVKRILAFALSVCLCIGMLSLSATAVDIQPPADGNFTLLWVTDPQIYTNKYPEILSAQNDWILANANRLNVKYAIHTGDLVHYDSNDAQWQFVSNEYKKWDDAGFAYGVLAGNHDMTGSDYSNYAKYFGASRYNNTETNWWYGGDYKNNYGHYDLRSTGGANFVFVYLSYGNHSEEDLAWVNSVFAAHPNRIGVLAVHDYMATNGGRSERGELLFNEVVLKNPNVRMVLCGHNYNSNRAVDEIDDNGDGKADRTVYQIMANYQYTSNGGNGFIRLMECDVANGTITHRTYSPYTASFGSDYEDGKIYDEFGYRDSFVTPFDFSDPVAKGENDPAYGTVVYSSELSFAPTASDGRLTLPVAYQNKAENGDTYQGIGVYDRFFSLDAADAFKYPKTVNYIVTQYTGSSGHTIKQVIHGSSLSNAAVQVPIPQNGAVLVLPSTVSLDNLTVGRHVLLTKMRELATPTSMYATNITVPSWGGVYSLNGINREAGNSEWVLYDSLNGTSQSHDQNMLFAFSPVSGTTYKLTASATALGQAKSLAVPTGGFVLAINTCYAKQSLVQSICSKFQNGLQVTLNGHTPGVTPQYTTKSLLAPSVISGYTCDSTIKVSQSGNAQVFYNTDGLYPKADYTYSPSITVDPASMVLYYDYMLEAGLNTHISLYFNNGSVLIHPYFEGGSINAKSGDLEGDNVRRTGKIDLASMNIPDECFNADGTLTLKKIRVYASGSANKKLHLYTLAVTTDRAPVGDAIIAQTLPLLGHDIAVQTPSASGGYVYDNGTLTVTSEDASGYAVTVNLNRPVKITSLKNLLVDINSTAAFDVQLLVTTSADDARYGLVSDFWPNLCSALDNGYIPAGRYNSALDLHSCFAWNKVLPANGITTVKQIKFVLNGMGEMRVNALQISNTTAVGRFEDGVYQTGVSPSTVPDSDVYTVTDTYVHSITAGTTVEQLLSGITSNVSLTVKENGTDVLSSATVKTGMTLTTDDGSLVRTLIVSGDLNRDGEATTIDARIVLLNTLFNESWDDVMRIAADYNRNGTINTSDVREILCAMLL